MKVEDGKLRAREEPQKQPSGPWIHTESTTAIEICGFQK